MSDELQELHERAEHGAHNPEMAPVSLTMAILAVLVAIVTLLGHRMHTEEVVKQTLANDQWAYYQGKDTRLHTNEDCELAGIDKERGGRVRQTEGRDSIEGPRTGGGCHESATESRPL
jgi:hypothetical protein